jgi:hypothetical protein
MNIYQNIQYSDLTKELRFIADLCGIEVAQKLVQNMNGMNFYIPSLKRLDSFLDRYIIENMSKPPKQIAHELNCSEVNIRKRIKQIKEVAKKEQVRASVS